MENLVYYCGDVRLFTVESLIRQTHYFVMTATPQSLSDRGVFREQKDTTEELIHSSNVNVDKLLAFVRDVATSCNLPENCPVTKNHAGKPDVALFNFTERHMADDAAFLVPSSSKSASPLLVNLVGDALLQPFWPLGTGVNRAILSALDTAWMLKEIKLGMFIRGNGINEHRGVPVEEAVENRNKSYLLMKNTLAGSIKPPYSKVSVDPLSRYGSGGESWSL